jgi:hypothetical protein
LTGKKSRICESSSGVFWRLVFRHCSGPFEPEHRARHEGREGEATKVARSLATAGRSEQVRTIRKCRESKNDRTRGETPAINGYPKAIANSFRRLDGQSMLAGHSANRGRMQSNDRPWGCPKAGCLMRFKAVSSVHLLLLAFCRIDVPDLEPSRSRIWRILQDLLCGNSR